MGTELEVRPRQPLMLKEWLELESSAELSRDGFGCYPRHLAAELRNASGRRRNGDVIARVSAVVRAALLRTPPSGRAGEAGALPRGLSRRLRVGFWKKRRGEREEMDRQVPSCSAIIASGGRDDSSSAPAMSPRRASWEGRRAGVDGAGIGIRRSYEAEVAGSECDIVCRTYEDREQEQHLSPVSVMDFPGQDEDHGVGNNETGGNGHGEDDDTMSPAFARSAANIRRASQLLLQKIRQFEQLAELDPSDVDAATTATEDASCHVAESDIEDEAIQDLLAILQVNSPVAACHFQKLLEDFFRDGLASSRSDDPETSKLLLATTKSWLDGHHCTLRSDWKAEVEEIERLGWWSRFKECEQEMLAVDVEGGIFWFLMEELVDDLC